MARKNKNRALNAFDLAVDDEYYAKGTRHQQDIDLENIADERIRGLLNNVVNSDDDEEIDSDEAFASSDDSLNLNEEDEENWGDSVDEDALKPLSEVWDLDEETGLSDLDADSVANESDEEKVKEIKESEDAEEADSEEVDVSDDGEEEEEDEEEDEEEEESGSEGIFDYSESDEEDVDKLKQALKEMNSGTQSTKLVDAGAENPFALTGPSEDLSVADFVPHLRTSKPLDVPAPLRVQQATTRKAAYNLARDEIEEWAPEVAKNRQAEHLEFGNEDNAANSTTPNIVIKSSAPSALENKVADILASSGVSDERNVQKFEDLASTLTIEEVRKRRNELRHMRELMFREEQKAKRVKKIKSKKFHKVHKKDKDAMRELELDEESGSENADDRHEKNRVLERATLRHKNSKWAERIKQHGLINDKSSRAELEEMIRMGESLREKIAGEPEKESSDFYTFDEDVDEVNDESGETEKKGILGMKFMKDAEKRLYMDEEVENLGRKQFTAQKTPASNSASAPSQRNKKAERGEESVEFQIIAPKQKRPASTALESNPWLQDNVSVSSNPRVSLNTNSTLQTKEEPSSSKSRPVIGEQSRAMIKEVFADDNVVDFEAEKDRIIEEDDDKEIDETLPGWGAWSNAEQRVRKVRKVTGVSERKRRDFGKRNVIINEKQDKKGSKYNASAVPFPFENRQQYERSLRTPLGQEWVTKSTFQRQTKPRVIVKGGPIAPMKK